MTSPRRRGAPVRVFFVSAEVSRVAQVGGLASATAGLVRQLRELQADVHLVVPDYGGVELDDEVRESLPLPAGFGPATARHGTCRGLGEVTLIASPGMARSHPYVDPATGVGWDDNNERFLRFCAAAATLIELDQPDVVHLNDWHTAPIASWLTTEMPTVLTVHNLDFQGDMSASLAHLFGPRHGAFVRHGGINALAGAITLADVVITVSPTYAREITTPGGGRGLDDLIQGRGGTVIGIRNGIEPDEWRPELDLRLPASFTDGDLRGKVMCRRLLLERVGIEAADDRPIIGMVSRLAEQKGIDIALDLVPQLQESGARLVLVGNGEPALERHADAVQRRHHATMRALPYDDRTAHLTVAGSDLLLMPSRFEPCGLPQMQAMASGTIPVVTGVGGLRDTVIDADAAPDVGTGFVASRAAASSVNDALRRARRAWDEHSRRAAIQSRGMRADWSWREPAIAVLRCYDNARRREGAPASVIE